ncbi:MAG: IS1634 family transposase [Mycobacterium sp.]
MVDRSAGAMHVARIRSSHVDQQGRRREYESVYLRRSYREGGRVKHQQLANLSALPAEQIDLLTRSLKGAAFVPAGQALTVTRTVPHGHAAAVWAQARQLGFPALLGEPCRERDLAAALIVSRVLRPASKLSTLTWWAGGDVTLAVDLGVVDASTDEVYAAMDWLAARQEHIEAALARTHLAPAVNPSRMALFDLSSSWMEGTHCPLAARGYSRDGKKGKTQIEYGLLTDPAGRPVAVRVFAGNTADPAAFVHAVTIVRERFGLKTMVMVGDRGMITSARIDALREHPGMGWLTCLRAPAIKALAAGGGPLQMSLFDEHNLVQITHPDYPGERLVACRNPFLAAERARKRDALLQATETALTPVLAAVKAGRLSGRDKIGLRVGTLINRHKMGKHFTLTITDHRLRVTRNQDKIDAEAALDGIYIIRTTVPAAELDAAGVVTAYKQLAHVERDFRSLKIDDLDLRPVRHWREDRVRAHVLICMLAAYLTWHLRHAWAELTYTDQHPPARTDPVAPATRSRAADRKASRHRDENDRPLHDFHGLLDHLATLTRNTITLPDGTSFDMITSPTDTQRRAFHLLSAPIPTTLT